MNLPIAPAFADTMVYRYQPIGELRRERVRPMQTLQFPNIQAFLIGEISNELVVVQPLPINIEVDEDSSYVVSDDVFLVYGDGGNRSNALRDYVDSLIEFYEILKDSQEDLFDQRQFAHLQEYIQPKSLRGHYALQASRD